MSASSIDPLSSEGGLDCLDVLEPSRIRGGAGSDTGLRKCTSNSPLSKDVRADGLFCALRLMFVENGVQKARLEVWRKKVPQLGGTLANHLTPGVTHVVAASWKRVEERLGDRRARKLKPVAVSYEWIEETLKTGKLAPTAPYQIKPLTSSQVSPTTCHDKDKSRHVSPTSSPGKDGNGGILAGSPAGSLTSSGTVSTLRSGSESPVHSQVRAGGENVSEATQTLWAASPPSKSFGDGRVLGQTKELVGNSVDWMKVIAESARAGEKMSKKRNKENEEAQKNSRRRMLSALVDSNVESKDKTQGESDRNMPSRSKDCLGEVPPAEMDKNVWVAESSPVAATYLPPNVNPHITGPFSELKNIYAALGDDLRYFSYYKALSVLEKVPFRITDAAQVKNLPAVGASLRDQIGEILSTGHLQRLENLKNDEELAPLILFGSVWGIGPHSAQRLVKLGHRTLQDLEAEPSLMPSQRISLRYFDDINTRICREEVAVMETIVKKAAEELRPGISVVCGGSYRRGKASVGDMDFVITHPDGRSQRGLLPLLVDRLRERGFITEDLRTGPTHSTEGSDRGVDTYFGLCRYPGRELRHRVDFKVYPLEQYPYGLIAWTGNDVLNRRLRILADSRGFKLDDHGLYPIARDRNKERILQSEHSAPLRTEREVFEFLGFPPLQPHERNL